MHSALDAFGSALNNKMDQWYLIARSIKLQNKIKKEAWINSFKKSTCTYTSVFCLMSA